MSKRSGSADTQLEWDSPGHVNQNRPGAVFVAFSVVDGDETLSSTKLSRVLFEFGYLFLFGLTLVFPANMTKDERYDIEHHGAAVFSREMDMDPVTDQKLWEFILRYRPIYAWRDMGDFWIATSIRNDMKRLVDDDRFQHAAENHHKFLRRGNWTPKFRPLAKVVLCF